MPKRIAIVGRTNVGKSSLFNRFIGRRQAIVYDQPGVTIDKLTATMRDHSFTCIDTAGFEGKIAIPDCELLIVLFDGQVGIQAGDYKLARHCQLLTLPVLYVVNKVDKEQEVRVAPFYKLGVQPLYGVSAKIGIGVNALTAVISERLGGASQTVVSKPTINIALVGRQNAGKSL
ncbi:MAG: 50S ribosome-binding GTPase, partial [Pseudomonadota bacterium]|nr:50S ribosome-binding GTPase [Pseudomonadota bacterium]